MVKFIYVNTADWPEHEKFGLTSQIRRVALSVALNIVEGWARFSDKEFKNFLKISRGSLHEAEYLWILSQDFKYTTSENFHKGQKLFEENSKLLNKFIKILRNSTS